MHDPWEPHLTAMKCTLRYLQGPLDYGFLLRCSASSVLIVSTSGYAVFLGTNLVSGSLKHQNVISRSSAEVEYRAVANGVTEACWLRQLLQELHAPLTKSTLIYCDNVSAIYLSTNPIQYQHTNHVEIDLHFVRERMAIDDVCILHVPTTSQFADIFTKGMPTSVFSEFQSSLNIRTG
jgi:hypothetical protein